MIDEFVPTAPVLPLGPQTEQWLGDNRLSNQLKQDWIRDGFAVIPGAFKKEHVDAHNAIVDSVRQELNNDGKDEFGYGDRIGQLHQRHSGLIELATNQKVLDFLRWALDDEPLLFGSLNFDRGTQQEAHIDAIFFWPEPCYSMAGCWVALEDINIDAGPLFYLPGSHTWPFHLSPHVIEHFPELVEKRARARDPECPASERSGIVAELGQHWTKILKKMTEKYRVEPRPLQLKAGDVVFWHSLLAHGGQPRINPALRRRSVVYHYLGRNTKLYTFEQFMLYDQQELGQQSPTVTPILNYDGRLEYMRFDNFTTYSEGQEILHPVR